MTRYFDFIHDMTAADPELGQVAEGLYRSIFESSATDINPKQIAAEKGITQQGIVDNGNLCQDKTVQQSDDPTVNRLIKTSYASRFGYRKGEVSPAIRSRTSNGMAGGCGPQNVSASCNTPGSN